MNKMIRIIMFIVHLKILLFCKHISVPSHHVATNYFISLAITIIFSETTYSVDEDDGPAQPVLVLSNPSATGFTVRVREVERSATSEQIKIHQYINISIDRTGNDDYGPGVYTVTIPAGATMIPFDIPIVDDGTFEDNEDFDIIIVPGSLPTSVTRGNPGRARVTIEDDNGQ